MTTEKFWDHFHAIYADLPRQGPGERASTERALGFLPPLTAGSRILDVGCGTGAQTLDLARATPARIVAVDAHAPFVATLEGRIQEAGLGDRVRAQVGDMGDLRFAKGSFDVIWCEGAIFIIGFARGLAAWRDLLVPGGYLVVSEFCWGKPDPPEDLLAIFRGDVPVEATMAHRRADIAAAGYDLVGEFMLPARGWWDEYYVPLAGALARFRAAHAGDAEALAVADGCQHEIDAYVRYPEHFGYGFFVMRRRSLG